MSQTARLTLAWGSCRRCGMPTEYIHVPPFWLCARCVYDLIERQRPDGLCPVWTHGPGLYDTELAALVLAAAGWTARAAAGPLRLALKGSESARFRAMRRARALPERVREQLYWRVRAEALALVPDVPRGFLKCARPPRWRERALAALQSGCTVDEAARVAGVSVYVLWRERRVDPEFAAAYVQAMAAAPVVPRRRRVCA